MNCLEYVLSKLTASEGEYLKRVLSEFAFDIDKYKLKEGAVIVFAHSFHVGFAVVDEYFNIVTDESSEGYEEPFSRQLSLYDDRLKVALLNPKLKKGTKLLCQD